MISTVLTILLGFLLGISLVLSVIFYFAIRQHYDKMEEDLPFEPSYDGVFYEVTTLMGNNPDIISKNGKYYKLVFLNKGEIE